MKIVIENVDPNNDQSLFQVSLNEFVIGVGLTSAQAHIVIGEIFERTLPPARRTSPPRRPVAHLAN